jgi:hypothetical protein
MSEDGGFQAVRAVGAGRKFTDSYCIMPLHVDFCGWAYTGGDFLRFFCAAHASRAAPRALTIRQPRENSKLSYETHVVWRPLHVTGTSPNDDRQWFFVVGVKNV